MEIILMVFLKIILSRAIWSYWPKMVFTSSFRSAFRLLFWFCAIKGTKDLHENFISSFSRRKLNWGNLIFLGHFLLFDRVQSKVSQATVTIGSLSSQDMISFMITTGSLNSQYMIRILKQSRHDFSGKHLCDGYCMDTM